MIAQEVPDPKAADGPFPFVDTAIGGANRRNNVRRIEDFRPPADGIDCYATWLRYPEDLVEHVAATRNAKGQPSVKGYAGPALALSLPADFDDEGDLDAALADARTYVRRLGDRFDVPSNAVCPFFSGNKGFSVEVPSALFGGFAPGPAPVLARRLGALAGALAEGLPTLDPKIYEPVRLWRWPNTVNGKSGRRKIPLTTRELLTLDLDAILRLAAAPREVERVPDDEWEARPDLVVLWQQTAARPQRSATARPVAAGSKVLTDAQTDALVALIGRSWTPGHKHDLGLCLAGFLAKGGIGEDRALGIVERLAADDEDPDDRFDGVRGTYDRVRAGLPVLGHQGLRKLLDPGDLRSLETLVAGAEPAREETHAAGDDGPAAPTAPTGGGSRPRIDAGDQDLERISTEAWNALDRSNHPPRLFRFGGVPVRVEGGGDDTVPIAQALNEDRLGHELARSAVWYKTTEKGGERSASPPTRMIRDMLAAPSYPLSPLLSIVQTPVFAPDGSLHTEAGYHAAGRTFYAPSPGFSVPPVPERPTAADVARARALIVDDLLGEFPFVDGAERANAVALFLDPYVRNLIDGPTPLRLIEAPAPGSGKGLLADVVLRPAVGRRVAVMPAANDDDEWRKRITAQLCLMPAAILIDNIVKALDSGSLSSALTATWWTDRRLGAHEMVNVPVRCAWLGTANNPTMSTELARRTVRIRLDAKVDRPWQRTGFRHEDLRTWVDDNRAALVWSALVLGRAWIADGAPLSSVTLGSFERWAAVVGGILETAGVDGFLGNLEVFYEAADTEGAIWRQLVALWSEQHGEGEVGVAELFGIATTVEGFDFGKGSERAQKTAFGVALNGQRDRVIGEFRVVNTRTLQRAKRWRLIRAQPGANPFSTLYEDGRSENGHGAGDAAEDDPWTG